MELIKPSYLTMKGKVERIQNKILEKYGLTYEQVTKKSRDPYLAECRHVCIYAAMRVGMTGKDSAATMKGGSHTVAIYSRDKINELTEIDKELNEIINNIIYSEM